MRKNLLISGLLIISIGLAGLGAAGTLVAEAESTAPTRIIASALGPSLLATFDSVFGSYRPGLLAVCALPLVVALVAPWVPDPQHRAGG